MNKTARFIATMAAVTVMTGAMAQNTTTPYSMYGYGMLRDNATSMQRQMGSVAWP